MAKKTVTLIQRFFALHELQRLLYEQILETCKELHKQPMEISRERNEAVTPGNILRAWLLEHKDNLLLAIAELGRETELLSRSYWWVVDPANRRRLNALLCSIRKIIENIMEQEEQSEKAQKALIASHRRRNVELGTLRLSTAP